MSQFTPFQGWSTNTRSLQNYRKNARGAASSAAMLFLFLALALVGCEKAQQSQIAGPNSLTELPPKTEVTSIKQTEEPTLELYSSLAGKMARMEELLNAIDRFLDAPAFQDRLFADAQEFHELLAESHGLYPMELIPEDQQRFDKTIDQSAATSRKLIDSLRANNSQAAREALNQLCKQRQKAHARFSY